MGFFLFFSVLSMLDYTVKLASEPFFFFSNKKKYSSKQSNKKMSVATCFPSYFVAIKNGNRTTKTTARIKFRYNIRSYSTPI